MQKRISNLGAFAWLRWAMRSDGTVSIPSQAFVPVNAAFHGNSSLTALFGCVVLLVGVAFCATPLEAATKFWDLNGATAGAGGATPTGTWNTTTANWNATADGTGSATTFASGDSPVFSAGTDATGDYIVSLGPMTSGPVTVEEGTVTLNFTSGSLTVQNITIGGGARFFIKQALVLTVAAGGSCTLNGGTIGNSNPGSAGSFFGSSTANANMKIVLGAGGGKVSANGGAGIITIYTGLIEGTGPLTIDGSGVFRLTTTVATYSGPTIINGTLQMSTTANVLPSGTALTISSGGKYDMQASQTVASLEGGGSLATTSPNVLTIGGTASTVFSGIWSGSGRMNVNKSGGVGTLTFDGVNTASGRFTLTAGTVTVNAGKALCGPVCDVFIDGGKLNLNNLAQTIENLSGTGGELVLGAGHILTSDPIASTTNSSIISGSGGLTRLNASATTRTLTLRGANTYDGITTVTKGIISVGSATALGSTVGKTVVGSGGGEILFTGAGTTFTCAEPFEIAGIGAGDNGAIAVIASAAPTLSGMVTLTADATVTVSSSASATFNAATAFSGTSQTLTLAGGANPSGSKAITGAIALGSGGLVKSQGGTWILSGVNTYTGPTAINAGRLMINSPGSLAAGSSVTVASGATLGGNGLINGPVTVALGGTLAPGASIGTLTLATPPVLNGTITNEIDRTASPNSDKLVITSGTLTYGGTLVVTNLGPALQLNDTFDMFDANAFAGAFATMILPTLPAGLAWDISQLTVDGSISVICDGSVTASVVVDQNVTCSGSDDGKATVTFSGNAAPFQVQLDAGAYAPQISPYQFTGLAPGSHAVTVKDANGCTFATNFVVSVISCDVATSPCWRGQSGSTYAAWTFATSNNPSALLPDLLTNSFGGATGSLTLGTFSDGYIFSDFFLGSQQGIWDMGHLGTLSLDITNTSSGSGGSFKYLHVTVTQFRDSLYNEDAAVEVPGGFLLGRGESLVGTNAFGGEWIAVATLWRLGSPCPANEAVVITSGTNGTLVDEVVVETICLDGITCLPDVMANTDPGQCSKSNVTWSLPTFDGCLVTNATFVPPLGSTFPKGTNVVTMTVADYAGGTQSCQFNVIVTDNEPPTVVCPSDIIAARTPGLCGAYVSFAPTALDNCPGATAACSPPSGAFFALGLTTVTCTATDAVGNVSASCTFTVRVDDYTGDVTPFQPCWRGQAGSTFQMWTFSVSNNPAALAPNLVTNVFGGAVGSIDFGTFSDAYIDSDLFLGCRQGIWDLGHTGRLTLSLSNTTSGSAGSYKYVQVVVTQFRDSLYDENAGVALAGGVLVDSTEAVVGTNSFGGEWRAVKTLWRLGSPCPAAEAVEITAGTNGTLVDQVLVETICADLTCPTDLLASADPGQCSKSNVTWTVPTVDGCLVTNVVCSPTSGSTFPVGTNVVSCTILDNAGGSQVCNFNVVILDTTAPLIVSAIATEAQAEAGVVDVKNCANTAIQGTVNLSLLATDDCQPLSVTIVLTNGVSTENATFVNESPGGTYNLTWPVTSATSNGTWTATVTVTDPSGNVATTAFTVCVNKTQITGLVQLEDFVGTGASVLHSRVVTFVATTNATVLKTWVLALTNVSGDTFSYSLTDVPADLNGLSAKTAWNLREKLGITLDASGQAVANFVSDGTAGWSNATDHYLRGGDIVGDNIVNLPDYTLLKNNYLTLFAPADINGDDVANLTDYNLVKGNWFSLGDAE